MTARHAFENFIVDMSFSDMPVRFLREVATANYTITNLGPSSRVLPSLDVLLLDDYDLHLMSVALADARA